MDPRSALDECTTRRTCRSKAHLSSCPKSSGPGEQPAADADPAFLLPGSGSAAGDRTAPGPEPHTEPLTDDEHSLVKALQLWDAAVTERDQLRRGVRAAKRLLDHRTAQLAEARAEVLRLRAGVEGLVQSLEGDEDRTGRDHHATEARALLEMGGEPSTEEPKPHANWSELHDQGGEG